MIIEDEQKTFAYLHKSLSENGFIVDVAARGEDGLPLARVVSMMFQTKTQRYERAPPGARGKHTPVLFLTARDAIHHRVKGLELGAAFGHLPRRIRGPRG